MKPNRLEAVKLVGAARRKRVKREGADSPCIEVDCSHYAVLLEFMPICVECERFLRGPKGPRDNYDGPGP